MSSSSGLLINKGGFRQGLHDGLPICFGYLSVAFAFGIFSTGSGLSLLETLLISMTNVTSAGQLAGVPIIAAGGSLAELALAQLVINLRYALMSVSLSQKLAPDVRLGDRFVIAFVNTDEVYAVAASRPGSVGRGYMYGLIIPPFLGWSTGTLIGCIAGSLLPEMIVNALGIAIYGMFIAIVLPPARKSAPVAFCAVIAAAISCAFKFIPVLSGVSGGFVIIIAGVASAVIMAAIAPIKDGQNEQDGSDTTDSSDLSDTSVSSDLSDASDANDGAELADGAASAAELSDGAVSAELSDGSASDEAYCATARADEHKDGMPVEDLVSGGDGAHEKAEEAAE